MSGHMTAIFSLDPGWLLWLKLLVVHLAALAGCAFAHRLVRPAVQSGHHALAYTLSLLLLVMHLWVPLTLMSPFSGAHLEPLLITPIAGSLCLAAFKAGDRPLPLPLPALLSTACPW